MPSEPLRLSDLVYDKQKKEMKRTSGDWWKTNCPFPDHEDKTPSFSLNDKIGDCGVYNCFGCGQKGTGDKFAQEFYRKSWNDLENSEIGAQLRTDGAASSVRAGGVNAVGGAATAPVRSAGSSAQLNAQAGIAAEESATASYAREDIIRVNEAAATWFRNQWVVGFDRADALKYIYVNREFSLATRNEYNLGYAPPRKYNDVVKYLRNKDFDDDLIVAAGLAKKHEKGYTYPVFVKRLMIPWHDEDGQVMAFGGRLLPTRLNEEASKYLNTRTTDVYTKGQVLFNLHRAAPAIEQAKRLIVVEGYLDVVSLHQAGIREVVSPIGVALSEAQMRILWRLADNPILCLDGDKAGSNASLRAAQLAESIRPAGKSLSFALLSGGQDPDDVVRTGGVAAFERAISNLLTLDELLERGVPSPAEADAASAGQDHANVPPGGKRRHDGSVDASDDLPQKRQRTRSDAGSR